jgi:hypothetical protein
MGVLDVARQVASVPIGTLAAARTAQAEVRSVWSQVSELVEHARGLLARMEDLLDLTERRLDEVIPTLQRANRVTVEAASLEATVDDIAHAVETTRALADEQVRRATSLMDMYEPILTGIRPVVGQVARALTPAQFNGVLALLEELPNLVDRIEPALVGMAGMVPELEGVTERMENVGLVVEGLPGAKLLKRRGHARENEE